MNKQLILLFVFTCAVFLSTKGMAQVNLVKNPSLEKRDTCPWTADQIKIANYWSCIDTGYVSSIISYAGDPNCSPEYINGCSPNPGITEPAGFLFYHYPRTGNGMAQVMMYSEEMPTSTYYRDYLLGRLTSRLTAGQSYCLTFYACLEGQSGYAINHIGAYLDDGSIDTFSNCGYPHPEIIPQVQDNTVNSDTLNWTKIQGSFIANGTESYITIGNFYDTAHTTHIPFLGGTYSWYLVDDVSVIASNTPANAGPDQTITAGCGTYIGIDSNGDGMPCYWYVLGGASPIDSGGRILVRPASTTTYVVSMDLCGAVTYDTVTVNVIPCAGPPVASFATTGVDTVSFTYTGALGCVDSMSWNFGDGSTSTSTDPVHYYSVAGTYTVCAVVHTFCGSDTACSVINVTLQTPVTERPHGTAAVYPNPANEVLHIDGVLQNAGYRIWDMEGVLVQSGILSQGNNAVSIKNYSPGVYILEMTGRDGERSMIRVVKE